MAEEYEDDDFIEDIVEDEELSPAKPAAAKGSKPFGGAAVATGLTAGSKVDDMLSDFDALLANVKKQNAVRSFSTNLMQQASVPTAVPAPAPHVAIPPPAEPSSTLGSAAAPAKAGRRAGGGLSDPFGKPSAVSDPFSSRPTAVGDPFAKLASVSDPFAPPPVAALPPSLAKPASDSFAKPSPPPPPPPTKPESRASAAPLAPPFSKPPLAGGSSAAAGAARPKVSGGPAISHSQSSFTGGPATRLPAAPTAVVAAGVGAGGSTDAGGAGGTGGAGGGEDASALASDNKRLQEEVHRARAELARILKANGGVADGAARPPPTGASSSSRGGKPGGNRPRTMPQDGEREARLVSRVNTSL
jgi:hypothetical protein